VKYNNNEYRTSILPLQHNYLAPDGSEIRLLLDAWGNGLCHCTLPVGKTSIAQKHRTVSETWYFLSGTGKLWRKKGKKEQELMVTPGVCVTIPSEVSYQFCNLDKEPLCFLVVTTPPWPNSQESVAVVGKWIPCL